MTHESRETAPGVGNGAADGTGTARSDPVATPLLNYARLPPAGPTDWIGKAATLITLGCIPFGLGAALLVQALLRPTSEKAAVWAGTLTVAAGALGGLALAVVGALPRNWRRATVNGRAAVCMALFLHAAVIVLTAFALFRRSG